MIWMMAKTPMGGLSELMLQFLEAAPSNIQCFFDAAPVHLAPGQIKRAMAFIKAEFRSEINVHDVAKAAGASTRALQYGFKKTYGLTPMQMVRLERLRWARYWLQGAHPGQTVTPNRIGFGLQPFGALFAGLSRRLWRDPTIHVGPCGAAIELGWQHRRCFDFDHRLIFHQSGNHHHGHGGEVITQHPTVGSAYVFLVRQIFLLVRYIPSEPRNVFGFAVGGSTTSRMLRRACSIWSIKVLASKIWSLFQPI